jgi:hypothetical protein
MNRWTTALTLAGLLTIAAPFSVPVLAQDAPADTVATAAPAPTATPIADAVTAATRVESNTIYMNPRPPQQRRPAALGALYVSFAALQIGDAVTTFRAVNNGAVEANGAMKGVAGNKGALFAVKSATSLTTVFIAEKLWKKNRGAAIASMVVMNAAYAAIVANNARFAQ